MTIKQEELKKKITINWITLWFVVGVSAPFLIFITMFIMPLEDKIFFGQWSMIGAVILVSTLFIKKPCGHGFYLATYNQLFGIIGLILLITTSLMANSYKVDAMVRIIKDSKPTLITDFSSCSKKKNIVLEDYKLIRADGVYYIIPFDESTRFKVKNIKLYDYEEFN